MPSSQLPSSSEPLRGESLLQLLYEELRRLARAKLRQENPGLTLQATALVHEAYLRLAPGKESAPRWDSRGHFFAAAAEAMRRILVEEARRKKRLKRGEGRSHVSLADVIQVSDQPREDLLELDDALLEFQQLAPEKAKLVELRYFAGLDESDAAEALGISRATAARWWAFSKAWLYQRMHSNTNSPL